MIPRRFVTEYPERCLALLEVLEPRAREMNLTGTFSVMLAASVLTIPWERLQRRHPLHQEFDPLADELRRLQNQRWCEADFWRGADPGDWRFSRIMGDPNDVSDWRDDQDRPSMSVSADTIGRRRVVEVFRVLRNALAHGNVVYLNKRGFEVPGTALEYLGFLSRYEESPEQHEQAETYRLVAATENDFLRFVRSWATWIVDYQPDDTLRSAA